jgi:hypothetical protein
VYNITESKIYFKTSSQQQVKSVDFASFDFACGKKPMAFDLNMGGKGDVSGKFLPFSKDSNLKTVQKSFLESSDRIAVPASYIQKISDYQAKIRCQ